MKTQVIMSPRLINHCGILVSSEDIQVSFAFVRRLKQFFVFPKKATSYWLEINNKQWEDNSGLLMKVRMDEEGFIVHQDRINDPELSFFLPFSNLIKYLIFPRFGWWTRHLDFRLRESLDYKVFYIRLWYE